jgi:FkbM family methyltransferase
MQTTAHQKVVSFILAVARLFPAITKLLLAFTVRRFPIPPGLRWFVGRVANELDYRITVTAELTNGQPIKVVWNDFIGQEIFYSHAYEPETIALIERMIRPGAVFLDIGAHVGQYSVIAGSKIGSGHVHSFEPDPRTFALLRENTQSLPNVQANQLALSDEDGIMRLYFADSGHIGFNSLQPPKFNATAGSCEVRTQSLDNYILEHGIRRVDFVKMDVEGAELQVLAGATRMLAENRPTMLVEFNPMTLAQFGKTCRDLEDFLRERRFNLFAVDGPLVDGSSRHAVFNVLAVPVEHSIPGDVRLMPLPNAGMRHEGI